MNFGFCLIVCFTLLCACGQKSSDSGRFDSAQVAGPSDPSPKLLGEVTPRVEGGEGTQTRLQIACESEHSGLFLPNSQQERFARDLLLPKSSRPDAPSVLSARGGLVRLFFFEGNQPYIADYDLLHGKELGERLVLPAREQGTSSLYQQLGFARPRLAAASPDREWFLVAGREGFDLRSVVDPQEVGARLALKGAHGNIRWEPRGVGSELFLDRYEENQLRQTWVELGAENRLLRATPLPKAIYGQQIGLRRYSGTSLIWLEWTPSKSVIRIWDTTSNKVSNLPVPTSTSAYGPGFALYQGKEAGKKVVLQTEDGAQFFSVSSASLSRAGEVAYGSLTIDSIRRGLHDWQPGAVYSAAGDTQLFLVLPSTWGRLLFVFDGSSFRQLGQETCLNPDFYPES